VSFITIFGTLSFPVGTLLTRKEGGHVIVVGRALSEAAAGGGAASGGAGTESDTDVISRRRFACHLTHGVDVAEDSLAHSYAAVYHSTCVRAASCRRLRPIDRYHDRRRGWSRWQPGFDRCRKNSRRCRRTDKSFGEKLRETQSTTTTTTNWHAVFECSASSQQNSIVYRVAQKVAHFSTHRIFGTDQNNMMRFHQYVPKVSENKD